MRVPLLAFNRHAAVLWAPDGEALAITDREGSDSSVLWVVRSDRPDDRVDVARALEGSLGRLPLVFDNHHVHFEAMAWRGRRVLRFKVRGYGHEPGERVFDYHLGNGVRPVG